MDELPPFNEDDNVEGHIFGGRYKAITRIGEGGLGAVYKGIQLNLDQAVAIKVLKPEVSADEVLVARFCNEARIYAKINSPHVVKVHDFGQDDNGRLYLVMEFLPGSDLMKVIEDKGALEVPYLVNLAIQSVQGLVAAHELGIVHRDIKPENIMVQGADSEHPFARLLDFGISKVEGMEDEPSAGAPSEDKLNFKQNLTLVGEVTGTPMFMSPEQCRAQVLDLRSDIYSMGLVLYNMACGEPPFKSDNLHDLLRMQVLQAATRPRELVASLPGELEDVILRCLHKSPEDRYQSAEELLEDLENLHKEVSGPAMVSLLSTETDSGMSAFGESEDDAERAKKHAAEICIGLGKAHRSFILYPSENPIIFKVTDELFQNITSFTDTYGDLILNCAHLSMYLLTEKVYDDPAFRTSFPFKLYTDGVRRLFFHKGMNEIELRGFIECLRKISQGEAQNSDLVTLLWEENFKHISYLTVEDLTLESLPDADILNENDGLGGKSVAASDPRGRRKAPRDDGSGSAKDYQAPLRDEEWDYVITLIARQANVDKVATIARTLLMVLSRSKDNKEKIQAVKVLVRVGHSLIDKADLEHLVPILKASRKLVGHLADEECQQDLKSLVERASEPLSIEKMVARMKESKSADAPRLLSSYLSALNKSSVPTIIDVMAELDEEGQLPLVQIALMKLCVDDVTMLRPGVESSISKVIRSSLRVLAEIGKAEAAPLVTPLLNNDDSDIRFDAARAIVKVRGPGLEKHMQVLIADKVAKIRVLALKVFLKIANLGSKNFLVERLESPKFKELEISEQNLFFKVLARHESKEIHAALLKQLESEKKWFQEQANQMLVGVATIGLALLPLAIKVFGGLFGLIVWGAMAGLGAIVVRGEFEKLRVRSSDLIEPSARCLGQMKSKAARQVLMHVAQKGHGRAQKACKRAMMKR